MQSTDQRAPPVATLFLHRKFAGTFQLDQGTLVLADGMASFTPFKSLVIGGDSTISFVGAYGLDVSRSLAALPAGKTLTIDTPDSGITFASGLSGAGSLLKTGDRDLTLQGASTLTAASTVMVTGGAINLTGNGTLGAATLVVSGKAGRKQAFKAVNRVEWFCFKELFLGQGLAYEDWIRLLAEQRLGDTEPDSADFAELERLAGARILEFIGETGQAF